MTDILPKTSLRRSLCVAALCAICLTIFLPAIASAHAILLRSTPKKDDILHSSPAIVQMWFSEELNASLSTVEVLNAEHQQVDNKDAHINPNDNKELDITLKENLPPDVYVVVWRSDSADDGHVLLGSFLFTIANPNGDIPQLTPGNNPAQGVLGGGDSTSAGDIDATSIFNMIAVTLSEICAIFWMGAQLWLNFVLQTVAEKQPDEQRLNGQIEARFEKRFSLPVLGLLFLANLGVLYGQVLTLTNGNWGAAFSASLLVGQATSGRFGTYWLARMGVIILAGGVGVALLLSKKRSSLVRSISPLLNLFLGALLFIAMTMSGHAAAVNAVFLPYSVIIDWLHLLAAALWVGGMIYILLIYLPVLRRRAFLERARSLLTLLPVYSPLAIAGVVIMAITGPLNATFHLTDISQFFTTSYGRALLIKSLLVAALLATSAYHVFLLRPRLKKEYQKYAYAKGRMEKAQSHDDLSPADEESRQQAGESQPVINKLLARQTKLREERLVQRTSSLTRVLSWEPWLGVAVLICVGLMNIFAGTLVPATTVTQPPQSGTTTPVAAVFNGTAKTSDGHYSVTLHITPNRLGTNVFA
ncbi:MAG TPA: copper resistance protein CopC, partial [Ktedonobacteraceae bacterium]|nr:copper resistance protein CopC [Ktedonobacteraceae bacterium]